MPTTRHSKIFTRPDGTQIKIVVAVEKEYTVQVWVRKAGRKLFKLINPWGHWAHTPITNKLSETHWMQERLKHCTIEEIQEVAIELWEMNKPDFGKYK